MSLVAASTPASIVLDACHAVRSAHCPSSSPANTTLTGTTILIFGVAIVVLRPHFMLCLSTGSPHRRGASSAVFTHGTLDRRWASVRSGAAVSTQARAQNDGGHPSIFLQKRHCYLGLKKIAR